MATTTLITVPVTAMPTEHLWILAAHLPGEIPTASPELAEALRVRVREIHAELARRGAGR